MPTECNRLWRSLRCGLLRIRSLGEFADRRPNDLVYWEAIRWATQHGFRCFDLVGIERELAEQLLHDEKIDWTKVTGLRLLRLSGRRLIESPRLAPLFERLSA